MNEWCEWTTGTRKAPAPLLLWHLSELSFITQHSYLISETRVLPQHQRQLIPKLRSHYLRCSTQRSFNWPYRAMVKIPLKTHGSGSWSGSSARSNGLLPMRHPGHQKFFIRICGQFLELSAKYTRYILNFPYRTMVKIPSRNRRSVSQEIVDAYPDLDEPKKLPRRRPPSRGRGMAKI